MDHVEDDQISMLLRRATDGDTESLERLAPLLYHELHALAARRLRGDERFVGVTSLVHEAYLKLFRGGGLAVESRAHFFAVASRAMRQIVVDRARAHVRAKHGGLSLAVTFDDAIADTDTQATQAIALDDALDRLNALDPRLRSVVECRFFGGLTEEETGSALGITSRTVRSDWVKARALLRGWL
jgi:RNA polymerase sigma factor (TIGR02999 family)